jgi:protein-tyrosine phosphatase
VTRRRWLSLIFTRGKSPPPRVDPETLIIEPEDVGGARTLPLEGAVNFRDLGGYQTRDGRRVKWRRVFRSGALASLTSADLDELQRIGLKSIFDLRTVEEMAAVPDRIPTGAEYVPMTVQTREGTARRLLLLLRYYNRLEKLLLDGYTRVMIEQNARLFGDIFRRLASDDGLPAVIHCTAGKDRTGITSALLLAALGVSEATIVADYSLSNRYHGHFYELVSAQIAPLTRFGLTMEAMYPLTLAKPETMRSVLRYIHDHYGDVQTYLHLRAGVDEETLARLQDMLLE